MLDELTLAFFAPLVRKQFLLHVGGAELAEVELIEATPLQVTATRGSQMRKRDPFSLVFRGPKEFEFPQRIYSLEHGTLVKLDIFLVPIGPDEIGQRYEAVFN